MEKFKSLVNSGRFQHPSSPNLDTFDKKLLKFVKPERSHEFFPKFNSKRSWKFIYL